jgi:hypothetical protein
VSQPETPKAAMSGHRDNGGIRGTHSAYAGDQSTRKQPPRVI